MEAYRNLGNVKSTPAGIDMELGGKIWDAGRNYQHDLSFGKVPTTAPDKETYLKPLNLSGGDGWISVEDKLPNDDERCLALVEGVVRFCRFTTIHFNRFNRETENSGNDRILNFYWENVTHWQPLPPPVKQ